MDPVGVLGVGMGRRKDQDEEGEKRFHEDTFITKAPSWEIDRWDHWIEKTNGRNSLRIEAALPQHDQLVDRAGQVIEVAQSSWTPPCIDVLGKSGLHR